MPTKKPAGSPEWTDPDDAPEPTAEMLADAEVFEGNTFVGRGRGASEGRRHEGANQRAP